MSATDVPLISLATPETAPISADKRRGVGPNRDRDSGGARLLVSDVSIAALLLNEARRRVAARAFGVAKDQSFLVTVIAVGTLAGAVRNKRLGWPQSQQPHLWATQHSWPVC